MRRCHLMQLTQGDLDNQGDRRVRLPFLLQSAAAAAVLAPQHHHSGH